VFGRVRVTGTGSSTAAIADDGRVRTSGWTRSLNKFANLSRVHNGNVRAFASSPYNRHFDADAYGAGGRIDLWA
jgi:hypothetical protein